MQRRTFLLSGGLVAVAGAAAAGEASGGANGFAVDGRVALRGYQALVEDHLAGALRAIRALALTGDARSGRWAVIRPALARFGQDLKTAATVWFALPDGSYASTAADDAGASLADRDYFPGLMAGRDSVGDLVVSKSTGHRSIIVATPVADQGRIVGAIGVSVRARLVSQMVAERTGLPPDLVFYALDSKGRTAIHLDPARIFQNPAELGDASLRAAAGVILSRPEGAVRYRFEGRERTALFDSSPDTGWRFVLVRLRP